MTRLRRTLSVTIAMIAIVELVAFGVLLSRSGLDRAGGWIALAGAGLTTVATATALLALRWAWRRPTLSPVSRASLNPPPSRERPRVDAGRAMGAGLMLAAAVVGGWCGVEMVREGLVQLGVWWLLGGFAVSGLAITALGCAVWLAGFVVRPARRGNLVEDGAFVVFGCLVLALVGLIVATVAFARTGHPALAVVTVLVAASGIMAFLWRTELLTELRNVLRHDVRQSPGGRVGLFARLLGLAVPFGVLIWAALDQPLSLADERRSATLFQLLLAGLVLLLAQHALLVWFAPTRNPPHLAALAVQTRRQAARLVEGGGLSRSRYRAGLDEYLSNAARYESARRDASPRDLVTTPLHPPRAAVLNRLAVERTGLVPDRVWSRIAVLLPPKERRSVALAEVAVTGLRVTIASALCTAAAVPVASAWAGGRSPIGSVAGPTVLGAVIVAVVTIVYARARVADAYERRVAVIDAYRMDALRRVDPTFPGDPVYAVAFAGLLFGGIDELTGRYAAARALLDASDDPRPDPWVSSTGHLEAAAHQFRAAIEESTHRLERQTSAQLTDLTWRVEQLIRRGVQEAIQGPPRVNYRGWLGVEVRAGDGSVELTADRRLVVCGRWRFELLVRLAAARPAPLAEALVVTGGVDQETVEFTVEIDSDRPALRHGPVPVRVTSRHGAGEVRFAYDLDPPAFEVPPWLWVRVSQARRTLQSIELTVTAPAQQEQ